MILQLLKTSSFQYQIKNCSASFLPCPRAMFRLQSYNSLNYNNSQSYLSHDLTRNLNTSNRIFKEVSLSDKIKNELTVFKSVDLRQLKCAPFPAILYGFGGIIPFVFPPLYFIVGTYSPFLATTQLMYGATILAFIGGVKWGSAVAKDNISHEQIGWSTVPSLVAWSALLLPEPIGFLTISSGLVGALYIDLISSKYPPWFIALRSTLTGVAVTSLTTSLFFCLFQS